jgi:hypothetical protein
MILGKGRFRKGKKMAQLEYRHWPRFRWSPKRKKLIIRYWTWHNNRLDKLILEVETEITG